MRSVLGGFVLASLLALLTQDSRPAYGQGGSTPIPPPAPLVAASAEKQAQRGARVLPASDGPGYRKRWALVIGINYDSQERQALKAKGDVPRLSNAQNDARRVAEVLEKKYEFGGDTGKLVLLEGKDATRENIERKLDDELINAPAVDPRDCVLVYFSGHGDRTREEGDSRKGFLLPIDVGFNEHGVIPHTAVDLQRLLEYLQRSRARHKLLILDSCYSGDVYRAVEVGGVSGGRYEDLDINLDVFTARATQAITASRGLASDGEVGNRKQPGDSPFTTALLRALNTIPLTLPADRYRFTANQLFVPMKQLTRDLPQSAQCRWLDNQLQGEFHFFPVRGARFGEDDAIPDDYRSLLLAMVPSTFGNWWANEMPWFMPGLRREILTHGAKHRTTFGLLTRQELRRAAVLTLAREREGRATGPIHDRMAHLRLMLTLEQGQDRSKVMQTVINGIDGRFAGLQQMTDTATPEAVDLHYLAVLYQKLGRPELSHQTYERALERYQVEELTSLESRVLRVLCLLDLGLLELEVLNDLQAANTRFAEAEKRFGVATPAPFHAFCLIKQADALRRTGVIGPSDSRMATARSILRTFDRGKANLLTAAASKHEAWGCMETWRFHKARSSFNNSIEIINECLRQDQSELFDEGVIDRFHIQHGLAMIERFQGRDEAALDLYRELTPRIHREIRRLERSPRPPENYEEVRNLLYERLVNSLERQADCSLFGRSPDYAEAADDYRRALEALEVLPKAMQDAWRKDLLYRRIIALALYETQARSARATDQATSAEAGVLRPLDLARHLMCQLDEDKRNAEKKRAEEAVSKKRAGLLARASLNVLWVDGPLDLARHLIRPPGDDARSDDTDRVKEADSEKLSRLLARACLDFASAREPHARPAETPATGCTESRASTGALCELARELTRNHRNFDRDELERLMFTYRLLLHQRRDAVEATDRIRFADSLLKLCRAALHSAAWDDTGDRVGLLCYLRPYFDAAFIAKAETEPGQVKELIEIVHEATTGDSYGKIFPVAAHPSQDAARVRPISQGPDVSTRSPSPILALYHARGRCYIMLDAPRGISTVLVVDRSLDDLKMVAENGHVLSCPPELRQAFEALVLGSGQRLSVLWRDPVHDLRQAEKGLNHVVIKPIGPQFEPMTAATYFPFDLSPMVPSTCLRDLIDPNPDRQRWPEADGPRRPENRPYDKAAAHATAPRR